MFKTSIPPMDLKASYQDHHNDIHAAILRVLNSGHYVLDQEVASFEREFADYIGRGYCVGLASGTDALIGILRALSVGPDDYVVTVSHTAVATVAAIELAGAKPLLLDIELSRYTLDPHELAYVLENPPGPIAAIIPVHLYGFPAELDAIVPLARRYGIPLIEDCCQSHGAKLGEQKLGAIGTHAVFSFYPTKNLGAIGDAGAIVTDSPEVHDFLKQYREYGWRTRAVSEFVGVNSRLDEIQAAILRVKLPQLDRNNARRQEIARRYQVALKDLPLVRPWSPPNTTPVYHQFVVRSLARDILRAKLEQRGVLTNIHYPVPVHMQPAYRGRVTIGPSGLTQTETAAREVLSLPLYPQLSNSQLAEICAAISDVHDEM